MVADRPAGAVHGRRRALVRYQLRSEDGARTLHVAAFHPTGTAAAGADPGRHPVGPGGALWGVERLWVADASVLPSCPEVHPQVTIMALAQALARGIATGAWTKAVAA